MDEKAQISGRTIAHAAPTDGVTRRHGRLGRQSSRRRAAPDPRGISEVRGAAETPKCCSCRESWRDLKAPLRASDPLPAATNETSSHVGSGRVGSRSCHGAGETHQHDAVGAGQDGDTCLLMNSALAVHYPRDLAANIQRDRGTELGGHPVDGDLELHWSHCGEHRRLLAATVRAQPQRPSCSSCSIVMGPSALNSDRTVCGDREMLR